jgi:hypothetical protein
MSDSSRDPSRPCPTKTSRPYAAARAWAWAKAAELNGYPGPRHVLALTKELRLTEAQADQMTALRDRMSAAARPLGAELIDRTFARSAICEG